MFEIEKPKAWYSSPWFIIAIIVIIIAAVGVGGYLLLKGGEPEGGEPDFEVSANPTSISIPQGGSEKVTIRIRSINGFSSKVGARHSYSPPFPGTTNWYPHFPVPQPNGEVDVRVTIEVYSHATVGETYVVKSAWTSSFSPEGYVQTDNIPHHAVDITVTVIAPS